MSSDAKSSASSPSAGREEKPQDSEPIIVANPAFSPSVVFIIEPVHEASKEFYTRHYRLTSPAREGAKANLHGDSGIDVPFPEDVTVPPHTLVRIPLGIRARMLTLYWNGVEPSSAPIGTPTPYYIVPRSSIAKPQKGKGLAAEEQQVLLMPNSPGVIDVKYTKELMVQLYNPTPFPVVKKKGEAVVQLVHPALVPPEYVRVEPGEELTMKALPVNDRGGFGSTGAGGSSVKPPE